MTKPDTKADETVTIEPVAVESVELPAPTSAPSPDEDELDSKKGFIVKVRLPENGIGPALASTKGMADYWYLDVTPKLAKRMGAHKTQFFFAQTKPTGLKLGKYANWQDW